MKRGKSVSKKILVAEDYDDIRIMMKVCLETYGYDVIEAADGYEAVEKAVEYKPDAILMDLAMPVMDGIQATSAIRKHSELAGIPIVAVTAYADFYDIRARDVGCNDVIPKPIDFNQLKPILQKYDC